MSRQIDLEAEVRESERQLAFIKAVEFGFVGALEVQGIHLSGFAIRYGPFECFMTIKADVRGVHSVSFVTSDTIMNVLLLGTRMASYESLRWQPDQYHPSNV